MGSVPRSVLTSAGTAEAPDDPTQEQAPGRQEQAPPLGPCQHPLLARHEFVSSVWMKLLPFETPDILYFAE